MTPSMTAASSGPRANRLALVAQVAQAKAKTAAKGARQLRKQRRDALDALTLPQLKRMLKLNEQITTGTKGKLVKRIIDCVEHGCLPRCPECGLGRLKTASYGGYRCPGGYDDDEYMYCGFAATEDEIARPPWQFTTPGLV